MGPAVDFGERGYPCLRPRVGQSAVIFFSRGGESRHPTAVFAMLLSAATLSVCVLHGIEGCLWAIACRLLGALPDSRSAILYSLEAMTSYGHANLYLEGRWQLMGALEALNGWLLFGLTTAFLFRIITKVWSHRGGHRDSNGEAVLDK